MSTTPREQFDGCCSSFVNVILQLILVIDISDISLVQGDNYTCSKPPVDFETEVPFWPGQGRTGQAKAELVL